MLGLERIGEIHVVDEAFIPADEIIRTSEGATVRIPGKVLLFKIEGTTNSDGVVVADGENSKIPLSLLVKEKLVTRYGKSIMRTNLVWVDRSLVRRIGSVVTSKIHLGSRPQNAKI